MSTKRMYGIIVLCLFLVGAAGVTAWAVKAYRAPLGAALQATPTTGQLNPVNNQTVSTTVPADVPTLVPTIAPTIVPTIVPTVDPRVVCGENTSWNVLVLGSDAADMRGEKGSDLTRMIWADFPNRKVTVYAFPRELWVDTAGLGLTNPDINATELGTVFYEARSRSTSTDVKAAMLAGTNAAARMLANNFLISSDHYLTIDLSQIPGMVDQVGGIPINIPQATTDPWIGMVIPAGQQTLNGAQFVGYARAKPDSDFGRIQRNDLLIDALRVKMLDAAVWGQIPQLYAQFKDMMLTDLSPEQINHLACLLKEVPTNAIVKDGVKQEWTSAGPQAGSLLWDKTNVLNQMKQLGLIQ